MYKLAYAYVLAILTLTERKKFRIMINGFFLGIGTILSNKSRCSRVGNFRSRIGFFWSVAFSAQNKIKRGPMRALSVLGRGNITFYVFGMRLRPTHSVGVFNPNIKISFPANSAELRTFWIWASFFSIPTFTFFETTKAWLLAWNDKIQLQPVITQRPQRKNSGRKKAPQSAKISKRDLEK